MTEKKFGVIAWHDLTVPDAKEIRAFYEAVLGVTSRETSMGDYSDYTLMNAQGEPIGGVCHAKGPNAVGLPAQWLCYVTVPDIDTSLKEATERGGKIIREKWTMGNYGHFAVIQDPAGAFMALNQPA
jgi:predicted enzyme related to lactoylglutathione lyase